MMGEFSEHLTSEVFADTIQKFWDEGAWLMPTGGDDGKRPLLSFSLNARHSSALVTQKLQEQNSQTYGIRLKGMLVLDIDVDDTKLIDEMRQRFGRTDFIVRTGRGFHLYYRTDKKLILNLRSENLPVDVKQGSNSFVLGPHSVRPDGVFYQFVGQSSSLSDLPSIRHEEKPIFNTVVSANNKAQTGTRHEFLMRKAGEYIQHVENENELLGNLLYDRDEYCADPNTVPNSEVEKIANWWWDKRLKNEIYTKDNSEFKIKRQAYHRIRALPNGYVALDLYLYLRDKHGHILGKTFQISVNALQTSSGFAFGQKAIHTAIKQLLDLGYLTIHKNYHAGKHGRIFQLSTPVAVV